MEQAKRTADLVLILNDNFPQGVWPLGIEEKNAQGPMESFDHARLKPPRKSN